MKESREQGGHESSEKQDQQKLPVVEILNSVVWVNPAFPELPFDIEENKPTKLGVFFVSEKSSKTQRGIRHSTILQEKIRGRSGLLSKAWFHDQEGRLYSDVDGKGIGLFEQNIISGDMEVAQVRVRDPEKTYGSMNYQDAKSDADNAEEFIAQGLRTHRVLAIVDLEEIIDGDGDIISVNTAKEQGLLPEEWRPVVELRAFPTRERIGVHSNDFNSALEFAKKIVAKEIGVDVENFTTEKYLDWFAKTLGQQVARIRNLKLSHGYLTAHNITLDCRIVDLDSVDRVETKLTEAKKLREEQNTAGIQLHEQALLHESFAQSEEGFYEYDFRNGIMALMSLIDNIGYSENKRDNIQDRIYDIYEEAYESELNNN